MKNEFKEDSWLESTSELESDFVDDYDTKQAAQVTRSSKFDENNPFERRPQARSWFVGNSKREKKAEKRKEKFKKTRNFFNPDSDFSDINHEWSELSMQNELFQKMDKKNEIYENSKCFE